MLGQNLRHLVHQIASKTLGKDWTLYANILDHWEDIVGKEWANVTMPRRIHFPKAMPGQQTALEAKLVVAVPAPLQMRLSYQKTHILERIASYLGRRYIHDLIFEAESTIKPLPRKTRTSTDQQHEQRPADNFISKKPRENLNIFDEKELSIALEKFRLTLEKSEEKTDIKP
jgi:hypothetical protein